MGMVFTAFADLFAGCGFCGFHILWFGLCGWVCYVILFFGVLVGYSGWSFVGLCCWCLFWLGVAFACVLCGVAGWLGWWGSLQVASWCLAWGFGEFGCFGLNL